MTAIWLVESSRPVGQAVRREMCVRNCRKSGAAALVATFAFLTFPRKVTSPLDHERGMWLVVASREGRGSHVRVWPRYTSSQVVTVSSAHVKGGRIYSETNFFLFNFFFQDIGVSCGLWIRIIGNILEVCTNYHFCLLRLIRSRPCVSTIRDKRNSKKIKRQKIKWREES